MEHSIPEIIRYSYIRADQDGFDGEFVSEDEANEEEIIEAAKQLLDAKEKEV